MNLRKTVLAGTVSLFLVLLVACGPGADVSTPSQPPSLAPASPAPASPAPAATSPPAIFVNGEAISFEVYQSHLDRFEAAAQQYGTNLTTGMDSQAVIDALIDRQLLSQAARAVGFHADEAMLEQRLDELMAAIGGPESLVTWMQNNYYTPESLRSELALEIEAAWMRDSITAEVPVSAEQVLARQVLFFSAFEADRIYAQLENGATFDTIVTNNDPAGNGYLGWFPRGYLLDPELEQVAFSLSPGEYSQVIQTRLGYHILQVMEFSPDRALSADARLQLQKAYLEQWLVDSRAQSQIEILVP